MAMATTMRKILTRMYDDNNNDNNNDGQPWLDAFLSEEWWVLPMMMKKMKMTTMAMATTMRTILTRTYDDHKENFRQQPTLVGCIPGRGVGGWMISTMMTTMRMMTMTATMRMILTRTYADHNKTMLTATNDLVF